MLKNRREMENELKSLEEEKVQTTSGLTKLEGDLKKHREARKLAEAARLSFLIVLYEGRSLVFFLVQRSNDVKLAKRSDKVVAILYAPACFLLLCHEIFTDFSVKTSGEAMAGVGGSYAVITLVENNNTRSILRTFSETFYACPPFFSIFNFFLFLLVFICLNRN